MLEREDVEETTSSPGNAEPGLALLGLAAPENDLQTDDETRDTERPGEADQGTRTLGTPTNLVHSQAVSGNEDSSSVYNPSE